MARTELVVETSDLTGLDVVPTTAWNADDMKFWNDGRTILLVKNASGGQRTLTVHTDRSLGGVTLGNLTDTIEDGETLAWGPFPTEVYNQKTGSDKGMVYADIDAETSVTCQAIRIG